MNLHLLDCPTCARTPGWVRIVQGKVVSDALGWRESESDPCPDCDGLGRLIPDEWADWAEAKIIRWFNARAHKDDQGVSLAECRELANDLLRRLIEGGSK